MKLRFWIFFAFFVLHCLFINSVLAATIDEVRHMLSRTTFGGSWVDIQTLSKMDYEAVVKHLLDQGRSQPQTPPPDWVNQSPMQGKKRKQLSETERRVLRKERRRRAMELKAWWFRDAPHFVLGGKVKGGIYGNQPSLVDLEKGDLKFNIDFRRLYATVARNWWGLNNSFLGGGPYATLNFV